MARLNCVTVLAPAKLNLALDVVGLLPSGYHDLDMTMQAITLYERVVLRRSPYLNLRLPGSLVAPNNKNTAIKAALAFFDYTGLLAGVDITIYKNTPVRAGMAGGSTDAASTMFGVNRLFGLNLSMGKMMELGVRLGADVPYCVMRGTALAEGIGEKLTRITPVPHMWILIAKPQINVSTRLVYEQLDMGGIQKHPDIDGIIRAIEAQDVVRIAQSMGNVLENVTVPLYPVIETIKQDMLSHGAINAMMSGSGPTVFGIFPDEQTTLACQAFLKKKGDARQVYITENFN